MAINTEQKMEKLNQVKKQLTFLNQQEEFLNAELQAEREEGLLDETTLEQKIDQLELKIQKTDIKLNKSKAHIKKRKNEIKQWKDNFDRLEQLDKSHELLQLQAELNWRAQDIAAKESEIAALYSTKMAQKGVLESLNLKKLIVEKGYHKKATSEDPRLLAIQEEKHELQSVLSKLGA